MDLRHAARDTVLMVIVCLAAMFLHPIAHGPYSAVHGPTTTLGAARRAWVILTGMALAAIALAARIVLILAARTANFLNPAAATADSVSATAPLRC